MSCHFSVLAKPQLSDLAEIPPTRWVLVTSFARDLRFVAGRRGCSAVLAGLWDAWKEPIANKWLLSFAIITTEPHELTAQIHCLDVPQSRQKSPGFRHATPKRET